MVWWAPPFLFTLWSHYFIRAFLLCSVLSPNKRENYSYLIHYYLHLFSCQAFYKFPFVDLHTFHVYTQLNCKRAVKHMHTKKSDIFKVKTVIRIYWQRKKYWRSTPLPPLLPDLETCGFCHVKDQKFFTPKLLLKQSYQWNQEKMFP